MNFIIIFRTVYFIPIENHVCIWHAAPVMGVNKSIKKKVNEHDFSS